jgi:oxygen-independent coproporphyrinogen-3 oxidase
MPLGIYVSLPFCRSKCSYCNFASGVYSGAKYQGYVERVCGDIERADAIADEAGAVIAEREVDSVYLGGGTPTILEPQQLRRIFVALHAKFSASRDAEVTVECAPGTLTPEMLQCLLECGVNRVSLGVQSFVDEEARAVGRLHTRAVALDDIARLRAAGIGNINLDLIAGLPHQTRESWERSLADVIASEAPHVSVYMLEVDEDSRLGTELMAGGKRYHAHSVPDDELIAGLYLRACEALHAAGIEHYEISNFAQCGRESRHNLKYWTRQPYIGFGVDAHSMLPPNVARALNGAEAVRFPMPSELADFVGERDGKPAVEMVTPRKALEEELFLGLRLNRGIQLGKIEARLDDTQRTILEEDIAELCDVGLLSEAEGWLRLTDRGRLLSNEVFARFISLEAGDEHRAHAVSHA